MNKLKTKYNALAQSNLIKQTLYILVLVIPIFGFSQEISVEIDTLEFSYDGRLIETAFFKDNFYFLFETDRKNTTADFKTIKVYNLNGAFVENVFLPKSAISMPYCDLRVENQRLYLIQEHSFSEKTYLLEKYVADFNQIEDSAISIYEDSNFRIYPNCHGEWGASSYFLDKSNNKVYEFSSPCNFDFEKTSQGYLLTNNHELLIISSPSNLYESKLTFDRSYLEKLNQGVDTLFSSSLDLYTSFEKDNKLFVIYGDSIDTQIGELKNGQLEKLYDFGKPYRFSTWFKDNNTNSHILRMYTYERVSDFGMLEGYEMLGMLLIIDGKFKMYFLK